MKQKYRIVNLEQGSEQWKALRRNKVTSTDVSCFFGEHLSFTTYHALWSNKKGDGNVFVSEAMKRGSREESRAMNFLRQRTGIVFSPCVAVSNEYPLMTSLDGMDFDGEYLAEIKVPNEGEDSELWEQAVRGVIPKVYRYQIQTSLMITGAKKCYFFVFDGAFNGVLVEVLPDPDMWADIMEKSLEFHSRYIAGDEVPDDKTEEVIRVDEAFLSVAQKYVALDAEIKALQAKQKNLKAELLTMSDGKTTIGGGVRISVSKGRSGADDLEGFIKDHLPKTDLNDLPEKYKGKPGNPSQKITIVKKPKKTKAKAS